MIQATGVPIADHILDGTATEPVRIAAARGALPVSRDVLLPVLVFLLDDPDPGIRASAQQTIDSYPAEELTAYLGSERTDPGILDHFSTSSGLTNEALSALVANPVLHDETIVRIARSGSRAGIDMLLLNQERLARTPAAIEALTANESLSTDQRRRLLDFVEHMSAPQQAAPSYVEPLAPDLLGPVSDEELKAMLGQLSDLQFINLEVGEFLAGESVIQDADEIPELGPSFESVFKQILRMNPAQRLRAALRAGREARQILVRDTNRVVAAAVLRNPRLTEEEVVTFASQKSLSEEIFRLIGSSRAWMGSYLVMRNLVRNPKTPTAIAMNHIVRLQTRDLQNMVRDKNIPEVIRRMAKRNIDARETKVTKFKKH
jgi:hypothetical protein